jgi:peptidoglycan hydrolase-like protein with peptidoglycan-binding domain
MKIFKKYITPVLVASVFFVNIQPALAMNETELRTRVMEIIGKMTLVLAEMNTGQYCSGYDGSNSITSIQKALGAAGFNAGKIDGKMGVQTTSAINAFQADQNLTVDAKVGPKTKAALMERVPYCPAIDLTIGLEPVFTPKPVSAPEVTSEVTGTETTQTQEVSTVDAQEPTTESPSSVKDTSEPTEKTLTTQLDNGEAIATVRSLNSSNPDDTAVFTFKIDLNSDRTIYVPVVADDAFSIRVVNALGVNIPQKGVYSIVASGPRTTGLDKKVYFALTPDDTLSLRTTLQPGVGSYFSQLEILNYTNDDVTKVLRPKYINYSFDGTKWVTETIKILN